MDNQPTIFETMAKMLKPRYTDEISIVNIDDLLGLLRGLRKLGYSVRRKAKLAIWEVWSEGYPPMVMEFYVDRTRKIERGKIFVMTRPSWKIPYVEVLP